MSVTVKASAVVVVVEPSGAIWLANKVIEEKNNPENKTVKLDTVWV